MAGNVERDTLASQIATQLEIGAQYVAHVDPLDADYIALVRSAGRAAGRLLGWKVRTFQTDPSRRSDGRVVVIVAAIEPPPEDKARFRAQGELLIRAAFDGWHNSEDSP